MSYWALQWKMSSNSYPSTLQWKMSSNSYPSNQAEGAKIIRTKMPSSHSTVYFNNILVSSTSVHRHLGMFGDDNLS